MAVKQRILVISDTHGQFLYLDKLHGRIGRIDSVIHLGDIARDENHIRELFQCPLDMVMGNNDFFTDLPGEYTIRLGRHTALLTHGHTYSLYSGTDRLINRAKAVGADTVMFGHTHCPLIEAKQGVLLINPGSISRPRQLGRHPTYVLLELDESGDFHANVKEM